MPALVTPLAVGFAAAPSGTAEFYLEGTATPATVYSDAHGTAVATAPHTLDATGAIVRYVKARINVVVKTAAGATVKSFVVGADARDVRVENLGFTGPNAVGTIVPGGRTTVDEVLTDIYASLGAVDGRVDTGAGDVPIYAAVGGSSVFFVVTAYGAVGDGSTDDANAIEDAIQDADAAGGGIVVLPAKTFAYGRVLTSTTNVTFMGLGTGATLKATFVGTNGFFNFAGSTNNDFHNITFTTSVAVNATALRIGSAGRLQLYNCTFPTSAQITGITAAHASADVLAVGCKFTIDSNTSKAANATVTGARMAFVGCTIVDSYSGSTQAFEGTTGTTIDLTACRYTATGNFAAIFGSGSFYGRIAGGHYTFSVAAGSFFVCGGAAAQYVSLAGVTFEQTLASNLYVTGNAANIVESGCTFVGATANVDLGSPNSIRSQYRDRQIGTPLSAGWAANTTLNTLNHLQAATYTSGAPGTFTVNAPTPECGIGHYFTYILRNGTGSAVTVSWNAVWVVPTGFTSIPATTTWRMMFLRTGAAEYTCVSSQAT